MVRKSEKTRNIPVRNRIKDRHSKEVINVKKLIDKVSGLEAKELPDCKHPTIDSKGYCSYCLKLVDPDRCHHPFIRDDGICSRCKQKLEKSQTQKLRERLAQSKKVKVCLHPDWEHTIHWRLSISDPPFLKTYMTTKPSHDEMVEFVMPGIEKEDTKVMWVKSFCTEKDFHTCFEWRQ